MILYPSFWSVLSVQLYLKASHICTEWITRLDVVWRVVCFESLLLFIIPTARRVCSYPGRAGLSTMLGFEVCYLKCLAFFWNYFLYFSFLYFSCCNFFSILLLWSLSPLCGGSAIEDVGLDEHLVWKFFTAPFFLQSVFDTICSNADRMEEFGSLRQHGI